MALFRSSQQLGIQLCKFAPATFQSVRGMAGEGLRGFSEHEKTIEDLYFTKEDQRLFSKLLSKVKVQSDAVDKHAAAGVKAAELSALKPIVEKYKISSEDVDKLLEWKHTHY